MDTVRERRLSIVNENDFNKFIVPIEDNQKIWYLKAKKRSVVDKIEMKRRSKT
jgi:hypothetical protein